VDARSGDFQCEACCVRHIKQLIKMMSAYGTPGHEERIKDMLVEELITEVQTPVCKVEKAEVQ
jgi:hypothetical protein